MILDTGRLRFSNAAFPEHRVKQGKSGVYMFRRRVWHKACHYAKAVTFNDDGIWWITVWEVMADRTRRVKLDNSDQWLQEGASVRLMALWVQILTFDSMDFGT